MKSKTAEWFETSIKYQKMQEDGTEKPVTELFVVDALSFTEAETAIMEEASAYATQFDVANIRKAAYKEVFFSENPRDDKWYKVKCQFIFLDEKSGKEKRNNVTYLVQASSLQNAIKNTEEVMNSGMQDWVIAAVTDTKILDVFEHDGSHHVNKPEEDDRPEYEDAMNAEMAIANGEDIAETVSE